MILTIIGVCLVYNNVGLEEQDEGAKAPRGRLCIWHLLESDGVRGPPKFIICSE